MKIGRIFNNTSHLKFIIDITYSLTYSYIRINYSPKFFADIYLKLPNLEIDFLMGSIELLKLIIYGNSFKTIIPAIILEYKCLLKRKS